MSVPPTPFNVRALALKLPLKVAVPPVFVLNIFPVVVKAAMLCAVFPLNVILQAPTVNVPAVMVKSPEIVWVNAAPKSKVPPLPLMIKLAMLTLPPMVAVPLVFVIDKFPVVVNPLILWAPVPLMVMPPAPEVNVPLLVKLPPSVSKLAPGVNTAEALIVNGILSLNTRAPVRLMAPVLAMITPPVATKGVIHSGPIFRAVVVL